MNWKIALLLPGAIALSWAAAPMLPVISAPTNPSIAQSQPGQKRGPNLNLTDDQKAKLKQIREETQRKVSEVLTPEQRQQMETLKQQHQAQRQSGQPRMGGWKKGGGIAALNLSEDQKTKIRAIRAEAKQAMDAVFTPEQRQQLLDRKGQRPTRPAQPGV
jgi:periplasmic protein CpxP/Spy